MRQRIDARLHKRLTLPSQQAEFLCCKKKDWALSTYAQSFSNLQKIDFLSFYFLNLR